LLAHLRRLKSLGIKVIITLHNVRSHEKIRLFDRCEKSLLNEADKVVSHFETTELRRRLRNRLVVIPHGIEIRSTGPPETIDYANTALNPRNRYCLSFGNIRPYKGTLDLLRAWNSIHSNFPQHGLLIAGRLWSGKGIIPRLSGKLLGLSKFRKEFEYLRSRALSQRVTFFDGYLQDDLIDSLCRISELAIFPYHHFQAQSGAATRAAGFGRRLLVSNAGALPQLVHDQKFTFEQGNFRELCDKLSSLLAAKPVEIERDEQRQKMLAKSCSWPAVARQHVSLYHSVLESE
jgi:glycosyltransferase involved in cell wall biosynthesis